MAAQFGGDQSFLPVELTVNGTVISARPGQTILDVVREQRLDEIPTLCNDPKLEPYGSCFLCVVEVKGAPRLLPACVTRVRDGMEVTTRSERIINARRTALELLLSDHYADCICPAQLACPAGVDVQGYLSLARLGYYGEALALIRERNPLPVVCGRVCVRKCEVKCHRNQVDQPVGINSVKRYLSENPGGARARPRPAESTGKRVAVVGGGPGGLACANYLALMGHEVSLLEASPELGGMLRYGIPEYRLPRAELDEEIRGILGLGIKARTGIVLGKDFSIRSLLDKERFDAVFLALGAALGKKMGLRGENDVEGIRTALDFLRDVELSGHPALQGKVAVVGGGNSAIDAARTALRCGADEVTILYRRTRNEMPAHHEEVDAAEKEGVKIEMLVAPLAILAENGRIKALRCRRMTLGERDAGGRRKPVPIDGSETEFACDYLFAAIGQDTDLSAFEMEPDAMRPAVSRAALITTDSATMATSVKGVFAGGDVVAGPSAVIDAIAHGRIAAEAIHGYLLTGGAQKLRPAFASRRDFFGPLPDSVFEEVKRSPRISMPEREPVERIRDFAQVETGLGESEMKAEALRCMSCGCRSVFKCDLKRYASEYGVDVARLAGEVRRHRVDHSHPLIALDPNKCILCGRCIRTCAEIVGLAVLGFVGRGFVTTVRPALGRPLAESACIACGACVESCPTGALEAAFIHGQQGPWKAHEVRSVCNFCSIGCRLTLNVVSDGLLWATTRQSSNDDHGELCLKGRFGTGLIHGPGRLRSPLIRKNGKLTEATWEEAIAAVERVLKLGIDRYGSNGMAIMAAPRMTLEEALILKHMAVEALGTSQVGCFGQNRRNGPRSDLDDILGETASTCAQEDIGRADVIFLAGADPSATHPVLAMAIRRAARNGALIAAINSSHIDLLRSNDLWLDARRGTAGILLAAVLNRLLQSKRVDGRVTEDVALHRLKASVGPAVIEEAANLSGVDPTRIEALSDLFASSKRIVAIYDLDDTLERAADDLRALAQLLLLTNHLGGAHEGLLLLRSDCNSEGARLAGIANPLHLDRIRAALVLFENPLGDFRAGRTPGWLGSLVVIDHFLTETAMAAEVVLPAATLAESDGTVVSFDRRIGIINMAGKPPAGLTTAEILVRLCKAFGRPVRCEEPAGIRAEFAASLGMTGAEFEMVRELGLALPRNPAPEFHPKALRLDSAAALGNHFAYASLDAFLEDHLRIAQSR